MWCIGQGRQIRLSRDIDIENTSLARDVIAGSEIPIVSECEETAGKCDTSRCFDIEELLSWCILAWPV